MVASSDAREQLVFALCEISQLVAELGRSTAPPMIAAKAEAGHELADTVVVDLQKFRVGIVHVVVVADRLPVVLGQVRLERSVVALRVEQFAAWCCSQLTLSSQVPGEKPMHAVLVGVYDWRCHFHVADTLWIVCEN